MIDNGYGPGRWLPFFAGWSEFTPVIPKMYWDVKSAEQRYFTLCKQLHKLVCYIDMVGDKVNIDHAELERIKSELDRLVNGGLEDLYEAQIFQWIQSNLPVIFSMLVKQVYFGLTLDGYFCAYIPESWSDILFDTGMVWGEDTYGRLILRWDVDASGDNVNQRPENWR